MKKLSIIGLAILGIMVITGCDNSLELSSLDKGDFNSQWGVQRTDSLSFTQPTISGTLNVTGGAENYDLTISFSTPASLDIRKHRTLEAAAPAVKDAVKFYDYTAAGSPSLVTPPPIGSELNYDVIKWENNAATIRFTGLNTSISNRLEVRYDLSKLTHHNGRRFDVNNDGVIDSYDVSFSRITVTGASGPNNSGDVYYNANLGLLSNLTFTYTPPSGILSGYFSITIRFPGIDTTDYAATLSSFFKLQRFDLANKRWTDTGVQGTYITTSGQFRFTLLNPPLNTPYRVVINSYDAIKRFTTADEYHGFRQRALGTNWSTITDGICSTLEVPNPAAAYVTTNPFAYAGAASDLSGRNVVVTVSFTPSIGGMVGERGLPDPADALAKKQILLGYKQGNNTYTHGNTADWNNVVFIPITIIPYKNASTDAVENRWKIFLPAQYTLYPSYRTKYLFITPDYSTLGNNDDTNVRKFGNVANVELIHSGNYQYEAYSIGDLF